MKKRTVIAFALLILLTTIVPEKKIQILKFNIKEIKIENNFILKERDIKNLLSKFYDENLIFIKNEDIKKALLKNTFIESFNVKKKYPNTLKIKVFEKKPIAILFHNKKKFYLSDKADLIEFNNLKNFQNLPYVFGRQQEFKKLYLNLKKIDFPLETIKKYTFFESKRWDLETKNNVIIKLPSKNYKKNLENFLKLIDKKSFKKYKVFDFRIENQLILK